MKTVYNFNVIFAIEIDYTRVLTQSLFICLSERIIELHRQVTAVAKI